MSVSPMTVMIIEDDAAMREVLDMRLRNWGFSVLALSDGAQAEELAKSRDPDIVITDVVMPGKSGLDLLHSLKTGNPARPVILITAQGSIDMAVEAMKQGAHDFLTKPLDYSNLRAVLEAAQKEIALRRDSRKLSDRLRKGAGFGTLVGTSKAMRDVYELLETVATSNSAAIITGESGTGKELAARAIHERSARSHGPFIAVNAAAIPETLMESEVFGHERGAFTGAIGVRPGCFELAHGGSLFLDEIAEMNSALQPKLLRVLEDGRVRRLGGRQEFVFDVRVLAATNRDPREAVRTGVLREDLYYRLNVFTVALPPLRERKEDLSVLALHFIQEFNAKHNASVVALRPEVLDRLKGYSWPGNVRELKNVLERAVILAKGEWIELSHLPPYLRSAEPEEEKKVVLSLGVTVADTEKELILKTLKQTGNNKAEAARRLGLDVKTIRNKLRTYGAS